MWKCKKCGCTDFEEERIVRNKISPYEINENGIITANECNEKVSNIRKAIYCTNCGNYKIGFYLGDIADLEEEDERD